jgi:TonB family protein
MNDARANSPALEPAEKKPSGEGWTSGRWIAVIALIFATHAALIFLFGEKKPPVTRPVKTVPTLALADDSNDLLALNDPTLFALPNQRDFASVVWLKIPVVKQPSFRWTEAPQPLPLSTAGLGTALGRFMQTNFMASHPLDFRPARELSTPARPIESVTAQNSTMQIEGELAQRQLPSDIRLTNWPYADVLAPSEVQVLVDAAGKLVSAVLLKSSDYKDADEQALALARNLRFMPSSSLTFGKIIFNWHTVPIPTNEQDR